MRFVLVVSRKRAVMNNYVKDVVGQDGECENQNSDQWCNGFLKAGTSYRFVIVITACKRSLGLGKIFTGVFLSIRGWGVVLGGVNPHHNQKRGRYASYWNAFLFNINMKRKIMGTPRSQSLQL